MAAPGAPDPLAAEAARAGRRQTPSRPTAPPGRFFQPLPRGLGQVLSLTLHLLVGAAFLFALPMGGPGGGGGGGGAGGGGQGGDGAGQEIWIVDIRRPGAIGPGTDGGTDVGSAENPAVAATADSAAYPPETADPAETSSDPTKDRAAPPAEDRPAPPDRPDVSAPSEPPPSGASPILAAEARPLAPEHPSPEPPRPRLRPETRTSPAAKAVEPPRPPAPAVKRTRAATGGAAATVAASDRDGASGADGPGNNGAAPGSGGKADGGAGQGAGSGQGDDAGPGSGGGTGGGAGPGSGDGTGGGDGQGRDGGMDVGQVDHRPRLIHRVHPDYPDQARRAGLTGRVTVRLFIETTGVVGQARIVSAEPPGVFEEAVIEAVRRWRFSPARLRGRETAVWVSAPIRFDLNR